MRIQCKALAVTLTIAVVASRGTAWGQDQVIEKGVVKRAATTETRSVNRISTLMKSEVMLKGEERAGKVVDFVISDHGCIEYLVAEDDRGYYAIPYSAARVDYQEHLVNLSVTSERVSQRHAVSKLGMAQPER